MMYNTGCRDNFYVFMFYVEMNESDDGFILFQNVCMGHLEEGDW